MASVDNSIHLPSPGVSTNATSGSAYIATRPLRFGPWTQANASSFSIFSAAWRCLESSRERCAPSALPCLQTIPRFAQTSSLLAWTGRACLTIKPFKAPTRKPIVLQNHLRNAGGPKWNYIFKI